MIILLFVYVILTGWILPVMCGLEVFGLIPGLIFFLAPPILHFAAKKKTKWVKAIWILLGVFAGIAVVISEGWWIIAVIPAWYFYAVAVDLVELSTSDEEE